MASVSEFLFQPHLEPGEKILAVCHRHIFVALPQFFSILFFTFFIPLSCWYLFPEFALAFLIWLFVGVIRIFYIFFNWYHDAILLTSTSLIRVGWDGFFNRTSTRLEYHMIEGLSYAIQGFSKTVFNYGDISIDRAGGGAAFTLKDAINPSKVERLVLGHQETFVADQNLKDADALKNLLTLMLRQHAKTHGVPSQDHSKKQH